MSDLKDGLMPYQKRILEVLDKKHKYAAVAEKGIGKTNFMLFQTKLSKANADYWLSVSRTKHVIRAVVDKSVDGKSSIEAGTIRIIDEVGEIT